MTTFLIIMQSLVTEGTLYNITTPIASFSSPRALWFIF